MRRAADAPSALQPLPGPRRMRRARERAIPVFLTGMFDMANYGDLLYPLIARNRLEPVGFDVVSVAPLARHPGVGGAITPVDIAAMVDYQGPCAGVMIGGGYIIHTHPITFIEDYDIGEVAEWAGAGLWLGATMAAARRNVPIVWNAPGVPHPIRGSRSALVAAALRAADYVALRDQGAVELLGPPADVSVHVVPDTTAEIPAMWPRLSLAEEFSNLLRRKHADPEARYMALHLRRRSVAGVALEWIAEQIDRFARDKAMVPLLVAVGRSHDDPGLARRISALLAGPHVLLDDPIDLREITAALAWSSLYVGASLHGYIVSAAYGVPGVLVARPAYRKFSGFLAHSGRMGDMVRDWGSAFDLAARCTQDNDSPRIAPAVLRALDRHWARVRAVLECGETSESRRAFLDRLAPLTGVSLNHVSTIDALRMIATAVRSRSLSAPSAAAERIRS